MNKIFRCSYFETWGHGAFQEMNCIVIAPDKETAFKMVSERYIKECVLPIRWSIEETTTNEPECIYISSRSS